MPESDALPAIGGADEGVAPPPGNPRFPLFDPLRAIAAMSVLLFHLGGISHANDTRWWGSFTARLALGVPIFFVISGFLLYRPFVTARLGQGPKVATRAYFRRRALRIIPAYWFALIVLGIFPGLPDLWTRDWWRFFLVAQSYSTRTVIQGISPAWSLTAEVGFYLVLPVYAIAATALWVRASRHALRNELLLLSVIAVSALALRTYVQRSGSALFVPFTLLGNADWFAAGMTLALLSATGAHRAGGRIWRSVADRPTLAWLAAGSLFLASSLAFDLPRSSGQSGIPNEYSGFEWLIEHLVYGAIAVAVVVPATARSRRTLASRILLLPPLPWLGVISYGIFLWHVPLMTYLCFQHPRFSLWLPFSDLTDKLIVSTATSIFAAAISYYVVERRFLRLKQRRERRPLLRGRNMEGDQIRVGVVHETIPGPLAEGD